MARNPLEAMRFQLGSPAGTNALRQRFCCDAAYMVPQQATGSSSRRTGKRAGCFVETKTMRDPLPVGGYVRKLWPAEADAYRDHLLRLDRDSPPIWRGGV
jgi:hypothetical protein